MIRVAVLDKPGIAWAREMCIRYHYLHTPPDNRGGPRYYGIYLGEQSNLVGCLVVTRPEATRTRGFWAPARLRARFPARYPYSNWEIANLARVWIDPAAQDGGRLCVPGRVPGFQDRRGRFRSTLASAAILALLDTFQSDYLLAKPPPFLDQPWAIRWLVSYCDTTRHRGTIYRSAGFDLFRTVGALQLWRIPVPPLAPAQVAAVELASRHAARPKLKRRKLSGPAYTQLPLLEV
jgi:hypothetical protein